MARGHQLLTAWRALGWNNLESGYAAVRWASCSLTPERWKGLPIESASPSLFPFEEVGLFARPFVRGRGRFYRGTSNNLAILAHRDTLEGTGHLKLAFQA